MPTKEALALGEQPGGAEGILIRHVDNLMRQGLVKDLRAVGLLHVLEALNLVPVVRLYRNHPHVRVLLAEPARQPHCRA